MEMQSAQFLQDFKEVKARVDSMLESGGDELFLVGPSMRALVDYVFRRIDQLEWKGNVYFVLPALTGADSLGPSFLFQLYRLAHNIRITPHALHTLLLTPREALLLSVKGHEAVCGASITDPDEVERVAFLCRGLWNEGMPVRLGE